jgi:hypothetical protein
MATIRGSLDRKRAQLAGRSSATRSRILAGPPIGGRYGNSEIDSILYVLPWISNRGISSPRTLTMWMLVDVGVSSYWVPSGRYNKVRGLELAGMGSTLCWRAHAYIRSLLRTGASDEVFASYRASDEVFASYRASDEVFASYRRPHSSTSTGG